MKTIHYYNTHARTHACMHACTHTQTLTCKKMSTNRLPEFLPLGDLFCWQGVLGQTHLDSESFQILQKRQTVSLHDSVIYLGQ